MRGREHLGGPEGGSQTCWHEPVASVGMNCMADGSTKKLFRLYGNIVHSKNVLVHNNAVFKSKTEEIGRAHV